jgi:hypothetical protein
MVVRRSPWMHAIYDIGFFKRMCEQAFDVLSITPNVYTFQYALVLRRRETRPEDQVPVNVESMSGHAAAMT